MSRTSHRIRFKVLAIAVVGFVLGGSTEARDQTVFVSDDFASCGNDLACPPLPNCQSNDFNLIGFCFADCFAGEGIPFCVGTAQGNATQDSWHASGLFAAFIQPGGDTPDIQFDFQATGTRLSPEQLDLSGSVTLHIGFEIPFDPGQVEVSAFRFSGDPTVFDGVQVPSVFALVAQGLIEPEDVLFSQELELPVPPGENTVPFNFTVDVSGVPSEEIVVFASHSGSSIPVPAVTGWGLVLLGIGMLLAATWMLRRRVRVFVT